MKLTAHFYRQHDADFARKIPAETFLGWGERELEVPKDQSALIMMHVWNTGVDETIPRGADSPYPGLYRVAEYVSRSAEITRRVLPPLLAAARAGGLTVIHVASDSYGDRYPGRALGKEAAVPIPEPMAGAPQSPLREAWQTELYTLTHGEHNLADIRAAFERIDFAPQGKPLDHEAVVMNAAELSGFCRQRGIWHLIYAGFCTNACMIHSPGAIVDMGRLGYLCSVVRDATTAVEMRESVHQEMAKKTALWNTGVGGGYVFDSADLIAVLQAE